MKQHRYNVTLEHLADAKSAPSTNKPLQFEVGSHDDIIAIVERLRDRDDFTDETAAAFGVGIKLFSEVMLASRENPLFTTIRPHFSQFMKELKGSSGKA